MRSPRRLHVYNQITAIRKTLGGHVLQFANRSDVHVPLTENRYSQIVQWWQEDGRPIDDAASTVVEEIAKTISESPKLTLAIALELADILNITPAEMRRRLAQRMRDL